jgi:hypothetical protein
VEAEPVTGQPGAPTPPTPDEAPDVEASEGAGEPEDGNGVEEADRESFPASDPPSAWAG